MPYGVWVVSAGGTLGAGRVAALGLPRDKQGANRRHREARGCGGAEQKKTI